MKSSPQAAILMYHRIARTSLDPWGLCVSPENFSLHLDLIKHVACPMSLLDFTRRLAANDLPERSVVVTFDDGYVDNYEKAFPLLQKHAVPATLFVTTCNIDSHREFWWDRLETLLLTPEQLPAHLALELPDGLLSIDLDQAQYYGAQQRHDDRGVIAWQAKAGTRIGFFYAVWKALSKLPSERRQQALAALGDWTGADIPNPERRTMRTDEIQDMAKHPLMTIGAHSVDHPPLSAHPVQEQHRQILQSRATLEGICESPVTTFAYPHGDYSAETVGLLRELGFACAVTVEKKLASMDSDVLRLPRFGVKDVDGDTFLGELRQWFDLPVNPMAIN